MQSQLLYSSIYDAHDSLLAKRLAEQEAEREAKRIRLQLGSEDLQELPALSSFLRIRDAAEAEMLKIMRTNPNPHLDEIPELRSFLKIRDAADDGYNAKCQEIYGDENHDSGEQPQKGEEDSHVRNGFERMRRCRMALDALDQVGG